MLRNKVKIRNVILFWFVNPSANYTTAGVGCLAKLQSKMISYKPVIGHQYALVLAFPR